MVTVVGLALIAYLAIGGWYTFKTWDIEQYLVPSWRLGPGFLLDIVAIWLAVFSWPVVLLSRSWPRKRMDAS